MSQTAAPETVVIQPQDLPLHCNGAQTNGWNGHPRVFLPMTSFGQVSCPYCGTIYQLDGKLPLHHA